MKFEIELKGETIARLLELKNDMDADLYHSLDYDLKHMHKPSTWDDVIKILLNRDKNLSDLINDKNVNLKVVLRNDS